MNASQRRIEARKTLRAFPVGSTVILDTGKPARVVHPSTVVPATLRGRMIAVKRRDNRTLCVPVRSLQG